ncbi:MAG: hypothetical protein JSU87_03950 [Gemmatimonadota bacterium]|nr:MAG: hypothetical protein JSU87_03950 [Gemmatimonadota bacterium]
MPGIERANLERLAELARLHLRADEAGELGRDCRSILDYFAAIRQLDVAGAAPADAGEGPAPLRADRVDSDRLERPLSEVAPDWREGFFVLPRLPAMDVQAAGPGGE